MEYSMANNSWLFSGKVRKGLILQGENNLELFEHNKKSTERKSRAGSAGQRLSKHHNLKPDSFYLFTHNISKNY